MLKIMVMDLPPMNPPLTALIDKKDVVTSQRDLAEDLDLAQLDLDDLSQSPEVHDGQAVEVTKTAVTMTSKLLKMIILATLTIRLLRLKTS